MIDRVQSTSSTFFCYCQTSGEEREIVKDVVEWSIETVQSPIILLIKVRDFTEHKGINSHSKLYQESHLRHPMRPIHVEFLGVSVVEVTYWPESLH